MAGMDDDLVDVPSFCSGENCTLLPDDLTNHAERLAKIDQRLESYAAYYPSDPDLWPTALKNSIEDCRFLYDIVKRTA